MNWNQRRFLEFLDWLRIALIASCIAILVNNVLIVNGVIPTSSMENTLMKHSRVLGNRLAYLQSEPERGDIIIFEFPDNQEQEHTLYVKRIIGLPGDVVIIKNGKVYINQNTEPLPDADIKEVAFGDFGPYEVPAESYFVMGDNRNVSYDSRFWSNTYVTKHEIIGKVFLMYYPNFKMIYN